MNSFQKIVLLSCSLLLLSGCSSLPGKKDTRILETKNKAAGYLTDGVTQFNGGRYARALELFDMAYQLNASVDNEAGMVAALNSIGRTKLFEGEVEAAYEILDKALTMALRIGDIPLIMKTKGNLSDYYIKIDDLDAAEALLIDELKTYEEVDSEESALLAHQLSLVLRKKSDYSQAILWLDKSFAYNEKNEKFRALAADYYMYGSIHSLKGDYSVAFDHINKALEYDKMIEYSQGIASDLEALAIISEKLGNTDESRIYYERYEAVLNALQKLNSIEDEDSDQEQIE